LKQVYQPFGFSLYMDCFHLRRFGANDDAIRCSLWGPFEPFVTRRIFLCMST